MIALGLDLSIASTGLARLDLTAARWNVQTLATPAEWPTLRRIRSIVDRIATGRAALVCVEGPSYGSSGTSAHERAGLYWRVLEDLDSYRVPFAVIAPATLKKYATGDGRANKTEMNRALSKRLGDACPDVRNDDEVDACWLALAAGHRLAGAPVVRLPAVQVEALGKVKWPELVSDEEPVAS